MSDQKLTNLDKAAVMLMSFGKEQAGEVMKFLNEGEVKRISKAFMTVQEVDRDVQKEVAYEFQKMLKAAERVVVDGQEFAKDVIASAFGDEAGDGLMQFLSGTKKEPISALVCDIPPIVLENFIHTEHPQTIAFLLSKMAPETSAELLAKMNEEAQSEVLMRIANLDVVKSDVVDEVREVLRSQLRGVSMRDEDNVGGPQAVADILNFIDRANEERILSEMDESVPELAEQIRNLMFTFEDVGKIDDRGIQALLKEISRDDLLLSLKTASQKLKDLLLRNMSQRAAEMLMDDFETLGPTKIKDVEKAQQGIIDVVRKLEAEGKIVIAGAGEDEFV